jgi:hypothetical protein
MRTLAQQKLLARDYGDNEDTPFYRPTKDHCELIDWAERAAGVLKHVAEWDGADGRVAKKLLREIGITPPKEGE